MPDWISSIALIHTATVNYHPVPAWLLKFCKMSWFHPTRHQPHGSRHSKSNILATFNNYSWSGMSNASTAMHNNDVNKNNTNFLREFSKSVCSGSKLKASQLRIIRMALYISYIPQIFKTHNGGNWECKSPPRKWEQRLTNLEPMVTDRWRYLHEGNWCILNRYSVFPF